MKTAELFEAEQKPEWIAQEYDALRALLKKHGLATRKRPFKVKGVWTFGGELLDVMAADSIGLSLEKRVNGLQRAMAQHLFDLKESGREVVTYDTSWYGSKYGGFKVVDSRPIYPDDRLAYIEQRVKNKLFINNISGGGFSLIFQYGVSEPAAEPQAPKPAEKKVYRVAKGAK